MADRPRSPAQRSVASSGPDPDADGTSTPRPRSVVARRRNLTPVRDEPPGSPVSSPSVLSPVQQDLLKTYVNTSTLAARASSPLLHVQELLGTLRGAQAYNAKHHTLFLAAQVNRVEVIRHLLRIGTTLDWPHPLNQQTHLHAAASRGSADAVRVLLLADKGRIKKIWDGELDDARMEGSEGYLEATFRATRSFKAVKRLPQRSQRKFGMSVDERPTSFASQTVDVTTRTDSEVPESPRSSTPNGRLPSPMDTPVTASAMDTPAETSASSPKFADAEQELDSDPSPTGSAQAEAGSSPTASSTFLRIDKRNSGSIGDTDGTAVSHRTSIGIFDDPEERLLADFEKRHSRVLLESNNPSMESLDKAFRGSSLRNSISESALLDGGLGRSLDGRDPLAPVTAIRLPDEGISQLASPSTGSDGFVPSRRRRLRDPPTPAEARQSVASTLVSIEDSQGSSSFDAYAGTSPGHWMRMVDFQDNQGQTPLHLAVFGAAGQADRQRSTTDGADLEKHAITLPPSTASPDFSGVVTIISREWPKTHLYIATQNGDLPIHLACRYQLVHIVRLLLDGEEANNALDAEFGKDADWEGEMWKRRNGRGLCGIHEALLGGMRPSELIKAAGFAEDNKITVGDQLNVDKTGIHRPLPSALLRVLLKNTLHSEEMAKLKTCPPPSRFSYSSPRWFETLSPLSIALLRVRAAGGIWDDNAVGVIKLLVERGAEVDVALDVPMLKSVLEDRWASDEIAGMRELRKAVRISVMENEARRPN